MISISRVYPKDGEAGINIKSEIVRQQRHFLEGESGADLLAFAGVLDDTSAKEMTDAIESDCETVDPCQW